jgi:hypothetical protein
VNRLLQWFLHYGLVASVLVWAVVVGLMAYHLDDSPWRWAFAVLSIGGAATIGGIFWIRAYVDGLTEASKKGTES